MLHITPTERVALELLSTGQAVADIARLLGATEGDLEMRLHSLFSRLGVTSRADAVAVAIRRGLLTPPGNRRSRHLPNSSMST
jgi:two-component system nitrate/nitrite response regulator NarL